MVKIITKVSYKYLMFTRKLNIIIHVMIAILLKKVADMAKHRVQWSFKTYHRRIKEGRGQGVLSEYKPWITIHDLASRGVVSRALGLKTGRIHHLLSRNETAYFFILDASDKVVDIREQYPLLGVDETVRIAREAGIRHPRDPKSLYPYVLTSDFVITTKTGICVRSVKETDELADRRVREKLEIERRYWAERNVDWKIVTEDVIDFQKARNLEWLRKGTYLKQMLPDAFDEEEVLSYFLGIYENSCLPVCDIAALTEKKFSLEEGAGILAYQRLILGNRIGVDLALPMDTVSARPGNEGRHYSWIQTYV